MLVERITPRRTGFGIAKGIELQDRSFDPKLSEQLIGEGEKLDVRLRFTRADDLGIQLVKFAEAALLRPLVAECRAVRRDLQRRELLPAFGQISATDPGG